MISLCLYAAFCVYTIPLSATPVMPPPQVSKSASSHASSTEHWTNQTFASATKEQRQPAYEERVSALHCIPKKLSDQQWKRFTEHALGAGHAIYPLKALYEKEGTLSGYIQHLDAKGETKKIHKVAIVLKGTKTRRSLKKDLKAWLQDEASTGYKAHRGFQEHWHQLEEDIISTLYSICHTQKCKKEDVHLFIIGHSLGGAVAQLLAFSLHNHGFCIQEVITFGAPKVYNEQGVKHYDKALGHKTYHFVQKGDIVHRLGPFSFSKKKGIKMAKRTGTSITVKRSSEAHRHIMKSFAKSIIAGKKVERSTT